MKKFLIFLLLFFSIYAKAQNTKLENDFKFSDSFTTQHSFSCGKGSVFSCVYYCYIGSFSVTDDQWCFQVLLDGNIEYTYSSYQSHGQSIKIPINDSGEHTLEIKFIKGTKTPKYAYSYLQNVYVDKTYDDGIGKIYHFINDNSSVELYDLSDFEADSLLIPDSISVPYSGHYPVTNIANSYNISSLKYISLPSTLTTIADTVFNKCENLTDVAIYAKQAPKPGDNAFPSGTNIHVYKDSEWYDDAAYSNYNVLYDLTPTYTITYLSYDGTTISTATYEEGDAVSAPTAPTRDGYYFTGWSNLPTIMPAENITCTAQYVQSSPLTNIALDKKLITITVDGTYQLNAVRTPENAYSAQLSWSSSDESVCTIDNGLIKAVASGTSTITVLAIEGSKFKMADCKVVVVADGGYNYDLNNDGKISVGDVNELIKVLLGK